MQSWESNLITVGKSIKEALEALNKMDGKESMTLFVIDRSRILVGTLTDGDVRRGLLAGKTLNDPLDQIMYVNFRYLQRNKFGLEEIDKLRKDEIELIPLLDDEKRIIRILDLRIKKSILPLDAFIMAGGEGKRLRPLTLDLPKPLLKVGEKPIIRHNVDLLESYGIDNIWVSVNYLGHQIETYFETSDFDTFNLKYIKENQPLGTMGSVTLVDDFIHDSILVMNSDLLTNIDLEDFYRFFKAENADMAVASVPFVVNVPYAVMEVQGHQVKSFEEKPSYNYYSNAGIYLIRKHLLRALPKNEFLDATDLMEKIMKASKTLVHYPILGYWLDIGKHEDYQKAQDDIKHLKM